MKVYILLLMYITQNWIINYYQEGKTFKWRINSKYIFNSKEGIKKTVHVGFKRTEGREREREQKRKTEQEETSCTEDSRNNHLLYKFSQQVQILKRAFINTLVP